MLNSKSCNPLDTYVTDKVSMTREKLVSQSPNKRADSQSEEEIAEQFASIFYSILFQSLQRMVPREDSGVLSEGTRGLIGRYMPREMAKCSDDPLKEYIKNNLRETEGEQINEQI